ncbi:hypothetical protein HN446_01025, partial [bacterium]|nr:hypothetical protein [bacterium]
MVTGKNSLGFFLDCVNDQLALVTITVPGSIVDKVYKEIVFSHRSKINTYGFHQSQIPLEYVEQNFKPYLTELVTEFLFKFFVISFLYKKTRAEFIAIAGDPRISDITVEPGQDAQFCFELTLAKTISLHEWKKNVFKSPKRKRYKDIDRQASSFVREESENTKKFSSDMLSPGDWTSFHVKVLDRNNKPIFDTSEHLWLKVGNEEADTPCQETFLGKKIGDTFCTKNPCLQEYFNSQLGI